MKKPSYRCKKCRKKVTDDDDWVVDDDWFLRRELFTQEPKNVGVWHQKCHELQVREGIAAALERSKDQFELVRDPRLELLKK